MPTDPHDTQSNATSSLMKPHQVDLAMEPIEVARQLQHSSHPIFFDTSGNTSKHSGKHISIITANPVEIIQGNINNENDLDALRTAMHRYQHAQTSNTLDLPFPTGGACGTVDYDGAFTFGIYPEMLIYLHQTKEWWQCGNLTDQFNQNTPSNSQHVAPEIKEFKASMSQAHYENKVAQIHNYIAAGDIYQVNLTQSFQAEISAAETSNFFHLYEHLRTNTPAPQSIWINFPDREVLSSSPETFLKLSGNYVETQPIKGTRARHKGDRSLDKKAATELLTSEKEKAELVMITDLLRNDLGQVCEFGSIEVKDMLRLETLEHVHHMVSTVTGTLKPNIDHLAALAACFPGGSITGAPKKRAMEVIAELEVSPRGLYTGAIGYIGFNQKSQFNIPIRTIIKEKNMLHYHVGAGIVADSNAAEEYQETLDKAKGIRTAIATLSATTSTDKNKSSC